MKGDLDMLMTYILVAASGWVFDDFCGTPPRGPGPGPWWAFWLRKAAAMAAAIFAAREIHPNWAEGDLTSIIIVGGIAGGFVGSLLGATGILGRKAEQAGG
jgi:hypothetical protein